jgi:predicted site-specific integrase-resolvase
MEQNALKLPQMLKEKQTAEMLEVSKAALRRWRREGRGPQFTRIGRCIRYNLHAIEKFLAEHSSK